MKRPTLLVTFPAVLVGLALAVLSVLTFPSGGAAEEFEATHCFGGTFTAFQGSQELKPLVAYTQNGIIRSPNKLFNNAAAHCNGVVRGSAGDPARENYGFCKLVDADGDIIVTGGHGTGMKVKLRFLEGTGKWKGITGDNESEVVIAAKSAVPDSFHGCAQWKGKYEVKK